MSGAVTLQSLVKSFRGTDGPVRAVRGMDLSVERGETVALVALASHAYRRDTSRGA
jgi:ABC-type dipeptide/oligopeptide/nickel transport system ATPase component